MGEEKAARESIVCSQLGGVYFRLDHHLLVASNIVYLHSSSGNNLICVYGNASGYNNCKNVLTLEEALMSKDINGEISHAY